jgi:hypothetical protein
MRLKSENKMQNHELVNEISSILREMDAVCDDNPLELTSQLIGIVRKYVDMAPHEQTYIFSPVQRKLLDRCRKLNSVFEKMHFQMHEHSN